MYKLPKHLEGKISDELYEKLVDIARVESDNALTFGGFYEHFEKAVCSAALETRIHRDKVLTGTAVQTIIDFIREGCLEPEQMESISKVLLEATLKFIDSEKNKKAIELSSSSLEGYNGKGPTHF